MIESTEVFFFACSIECMALLSCTVPRPSLEANLTEFELGLVVVLWLGNVLKIALMWFVIYLHMFYHWHLSKEEPFIDFWTEIEENRFLRGKNYLCSCGVVDTFSSFSVIFPVRKKQIKVPVLGVCVWGGGGNLQLTNLLLPLWQSWFVFFLFLLHSGQVMTISLCSSLSD